MTSGNGPAKAGHYVLLVALVGIVVALQIVRERQFAVAGVPEEMLYVRSPRVLSRMALSFDSLLADVYWIRLVQYYGGMRLSKAQEKRYDLLYPLLDLTTSLDPHFSIAYRFGAFFLAEHPPGGAGRPDLAQQLLEKGMAADARRWEYPYDIGFVYYREGEYQRAAEWLRRAAAVPGAPEWVEPVAAVTLAAGGDIDTSRVLWRNLLASAEEDWIRNAAAFRLQQLDAIDAIQRLQRVVTTYQRSRGAAPPQWEDLIRAGMLRAVPLDPAGYPFIIDRQTNPATVALAGDSPLFPLPTQQAP
jgi:tetratricopeptide (TPR) repeat protein